MRIFLIMTLMAATAAAQSAPNLGFRGQQRPKHAAVAAGAGDLTVKAGDKTLLFVDVTPNPNIHVYERRISFRLRSRSTRAPT
jgi:hypothetical protein